MCIRDSTYNPVNVHLNTTTLNLNTGAPNLTFRGYKRKNGDVGVRNEIWIIPTVDVYKRQVITERHTGTDKGSRQAQLGMPQTENGIVDFLTDGIKQGHVIVQAVSYTHLDVYKRQK